MFVFNEYMHEQKTPSINVIGRFFDFCPKNFENKKRSAQLRLNYRFAKLAREPLAVVGPQPLLAI